MPIFLRISNRHLSVLLIFIFFYSALSLHAQKKITQRQFRIDSIEIMKPKLVRPQFRLDNRLILFKNQKLNISGLDAGVLLKNKLRFTMGYYQLSDKLNALKKTINTMPHEALYNLKYGALNLEFIYINTRFFSLGMPLEFGFGNNSILYKSELDGVEIEKQSGPAAMAYFGLSATFKPIRWIGLKFALGFRKTLYNQIKVLAFDGIYASVGLAIDFQEVIKDFRMYNLKKKYKKNINSIETAVDLITD